MDIISMYIIIQKDIRQEKYISKNRMESAIFYFQINFH